MVAKGLSVGGSLPVPNVQALVDAASGDQLAVISDRYIRPELEEEAVVLEAAAAEEIPVVNLGKLLGDDQIIRAEEAAKLRSACEDWGFFQLVNHGVPEEVMRRMAAALEGFFAQTLEEKTASSKQPAGSVEGYGQAFVVSEEQKLDWADMVYLLTQPPHLRNLDIWPTHPPTFRETLEEYSLEAKRVALCLLAAIGDNLGLPSGKLAASFAEGMQSIRMNYYPPCRHHADRVLGLSPHSDPTGLTLLFQTGTVPGLQIRQNGRWLPVDPLPGAFVVNIGDILEELLAFKLVRVHLSEERLSGHGLVERSAAVSGDEVLQWPGETIHAGVDEGGYGETSPLTVDHRPMLDTPVPPISYHLHQAQTQNQT